MPLHIAVVGAGLVGLGAAISLGRQGHQVDIYEKSRFAHEVGAAIHVGPMAQRCLASWGLDLEEMKPVESVTLSRISVTDDHSEDMHLLCEKLGLPERQLMVHRVDLHQLLLKSAQEQPTVAIHLGCAVKSVDPAGRITLADETVISADIVVGADGVHAISVGAVDEVDGPAPAQQTMYRFLLPAETARGHPVARRALDKWVYSDRLIDHADFEGARHVVIYPCRNNTLLNGAVMLPIALDPRADELEDAWNNPGTPSDILEVIHDFPEEIKALVSLAEDVKHWRSVNRECPKTFIRGKLVLVGDSAHPMKPTFGAGAGIGIEDAAVLGLLLGRDTGPEDVPRALEDYNRLRYERGVTVKYASEPPEAAEASSAPPADTLRKLADAGVPKDMIGYLLGEDALEQARRVVDGSGG